jgi:CubicO group peptidase (beta-lactamase class C family)
MTDTSFDTLHAALRAEVDQQFLPGVATALLRGRTVVDRFCYGAADREAGIALREDHLFRMFSSTKLITACAVLLLVEQGRIGLDERVDVHLPELADRRVLRPDARDLSDTDPARSPITVRHLLTHTSGLTYGVFDPGSPMFDAYNRAAVLSPHRDLAGMMKALAPLPLIFHPGTQWEYSVSMDVLGRLVEVVSGERFGQFLSRHIFEPLGMVDTDFWVPPEKRDRLTVLYEGADFEDPDKPGLPRVDDKPYPGAYLQRMPLESGGGGLVSTLDDSIRLMQALIPGGPTLLKPDTLHMMFSNQLAEGLHVRFHGTPPNPGQLFGLGSAVRAFPGPGEPAEVAGEASWGGLAGTLWWINPRLGVAAVLLTQRYFGYAHPYGLRFKRNAYRALSLTQS